MAFITAPDFYGADFGVQRVEWALGRPAQSNMSRWTGRRTVVADPWHGKWRARVELVPVVGDSNIRAIRSFLARCKGSIATFRLYATERAQNANSGVTISATAAQGATAMEIAGAAAPMLDGQMVTVNGQLLQLTAAQAGSTLTFEPPLRQQATAGTPVVTSRPYALVHMANSIAGWSLTGPATVYGIAFDVEEALLEADGVAPEQPFTPLELFTGQAGAWYDPSDLSSLWQDSAGTTPAVLDQPVGRMDDKSGNANHLVQATTAAKPTLRQDGSGNHYLEFDGVDDHLTVAFAASIAMPWDRISAIRQVAWVLNRRIFGNASGAGAGMLFQNNATPMLRVNDGSGAAGNTDLAVGVNGVVTERHIAGASQLAIDNGAYTTGDSGSAATNGFNVGAAGGGASPSNIHFYGAVMRAGTLSDDDIDETQTWLGAKCGQVL